MEARSVLSGAGGETLGAKACGGGVGWFAASAQCTPGRTFGIGE